MSLVSVSWTLLRSRGLWDAFDLDYILNKGSAIKFISKYRYFGIEDLPWEFLAETSSIKIEFLENKTGTITAEAYLLSNIEIVNGV